MAGPCSILMDFDYTRAKLCKIRQFSLYFCLSCVRRRLHCVRRRLYCVRRRLYCARRRLHCVQARKICTKNMYEKNVFPYEIFGSEMWKFVIHKNVFPGKNEKMSKTFFAVCEVSRRGLFFSRKKRYLKKCYVKIILNLYKSFKIV